jgi:asparagine synthase (glutamine-hydrolysing)
LAQIFGFLARNDGALSRPEIDAAVARLGFGRVAPERQKALTEGRGYLYWSGRGDVAAAEVGGLGVVINGWIYNRSELPPAPDDAAAFLALYRRSGVEGAVQRLNGDFGLALIDADAGELWLARDRLGLQPLYYVEQPGFVAFASRPRPLCGLPGVDGRPDPSFVARFAGSHYRSFDNDPHASPYLGVRQLPAAHVLKATAEGTACRPYWSLRDEGDLAGSEAELAERYRELLIDATRIRLARAERPCFTLSGGMDSSSVLSAAVQTSGHPLPAFSTVYEDRTFDESEDIQPMRAGKAQPWVPVVVGDPDVFGLVRRMVDLHDEPVATATWLSHYLLASEVARQGHTAVFGGLGGDELNAGEYEYFLFHFADLQRAGRTDELDREIAAWVGHHDHPIYRKSRATVEDGFRRMIDFSVAGRCLPDAARLHRYVSALEPELFDLGSYRPVMPHPFASYLKNRCYQDIFFETAPCCLRAEDRHASAFGLDRFDPFFDYRLVEFMFRVPGHLKFRDGVTKTLLRQAMTGVLPEATRTRVKKTGWNAPAHIWFIGKGADQVRDLIGSRSFRERGIYRPDVVEKLLDDHEAVVKSGELRENHMMFLWQLVNLDAWLGSLNGAPGGPDATA